MLDRSIQRRSSRHAAPSTSTPRRSATTPVDVPAWIETVERRYRFLATLDEEERTFVRCSEGDRWQVEQAVAAIESG